jgi:hypothetical protein
VAAPSIRFEPIVHERLRRQLLARGSVLASMLADILSGKDKTSTLAGLGVLRPGIRPEEALRKALDQVESRRKLLVADDARYGCCEICGSALDLAELDEMAWADRCRAHAAS